MLDPEACSVPRKSDQPPGLTRSGIELTLETLWIVNRLFGLVSG